MEAIGFVDSVWRVARGINNCTDVVPVSPHAEVHCGGQTFDLILILGRFPRFCKYSYS